MPKKEKSNLKEAISEHVRIAVDVAIKNFLLSEQSGEDGQKGTSTFKTWIGKFPENFIQCFILTTILFWWRWYFHSPFCIMKRPPFTSKSKSFETIYVINRFYTLSHNNFYLLKKNCETQFHILTELEFPSSLSAPERAHVHRLAFKHGLCSKSRG